MLPPYTLSPSSLQSESDSTSNLFSNENRQRVSDVNSNSLYVSEIISKRNKQDIVTVPTSAPPDSPKYPILPQFGISTCYFNPKTVYTINAALKDINQLEKEYNLEALRRQNVKATAYFVPIKQEDRNGKYVGVYVK